MDNIVISDKVINILIAFAIFLVAFLLRRLITYMLLKIFNWKKSKKEIKEIALYDTIKNFIVLIGVFIAIYYLRIPEAYMKIVTKAFEIITIFIFTTGIANSITAETSFLKKIQDRMKGENTEGMLNVISKAIKAVVTPLNKE